MHKDWCGRPCSECSNPCDLDESMPCSPDCECLGEHGEHCSGECQECDALQSFSVPITYDGLIVVRAASAAEAGEIVRSMILDDMYQKSDGTWDIEEAELNDDA